MKETHFDGSRSGRNFSLDRQTEPLVLDSEICGLDNLHAFLKHGNYVTRFSFPFFEMPAAQPKFIERLKDDFIVREPRKEPQQPAAAPTTSPAAAPPEPEPEETPKLQLVAPPIESKSVTQEQQATLPFSPEL